MSGPRHLAERLLSVLIIAAWVAVPLLLAGLVTARSQRSVRTESPAAVWIPASPVETETSRTVVARIDRDEPAPLLAPAWTGLVEEVNVHVGDPIRSGDPVVVVDGIARIAVRTDRPFARRLTPGDRGVDVDQLNRWLTSIGHEAGDDDRFGSATRRGGASPAPRPGCAR